MKTLFLFLFICASGSAVNKIFAQNGYLLSTTKMSFSYTKKITGKSSSTIIVNGNNSNAPMVQGPNGSIIVSTKNSLVGGASGPQANSNATAQVPAIGASAFGNTNYNKFFLQADQDKSLNGTMSYSRPSEKLKGLPDINFIFSYEPGNKIGTIGIGGMSASTQTITQEGEPIKIIDGTTSGGMGATTDIAKSMYGFSGMQKGPNTAYIELTKTKTGYRISYSKETKEEDGTTTEDLIAFIGEPDDIYEATITPYNFDFEHWLPTGPTVDGTTNKTGDVSLQFLVDVYLKGHPSYKYPGKMNVSWRLDYVTKYPGYCNNYPEYSQSPDITPDLIFNPDMKGHAGCTAVNNTAATVENIILGDGVARIICKDYAAWGKLSAVITLDKSAPINAISYAEPGKQYVTIPLDKDENKIADVWEKDNNKEKHVLTWDEDAEPVEQRENGDGYTLFEEYRGFAIHINADEKKQISEREDFIRTDPNKKDAFVYDKDKLFQTYYEPYNPSKLEWHYLSADMKQLYYDDIKIRRSLNRWVNFNKVADYFYSEQYGLVITNTANVYKYDTLATGISFTSSEWQYALDKNANVTSTNEIITQLTNENNGSFDVFKSPMKTHIKIEIMPAQIAKKCAFIKQQLGEVAFKRAMEANIGSTVMHEIGHCIGICHHKPTADSGPENCVMRYLSNVQRKSASLMVSRSAYCYPGETGPDYIHTPRTGATPPGEEDYTELPAGSNSSDNCYGKITVKSKPGK